MAPDDCSGMLRYVGVSGSARWCGRMMCVCPSNVEACRYFTQRGQKWRHVDDIARSAGLHENRTCKVCPPTTAQGSCCMWLCWVSSARWCGRVLCVCPSNVEACQYAAQPGQTWRHVDDIARSAGLHEDRTYQSWPPTTAQGCCGMWVFRAVRGGVGG